MTGSSSAVLQQLIDRTLALDLETTRSGGRIRRSGNPFIQDLTGDAVLRRPAPAGASAVPLDLARRYHLLGLADLYLG
jgi:hypothetical protein